MASDADGSAPSDADDSSLQGNHHSVSAAVSIQLCQNALLRPEEIHSVTGESAMLVKVRTRDAQELDSVLERMYAIEGFTATRSYIALSTYLERGRRSAKE
jgi:hypothetical protein